MSIDEGTSPSSGVTVEDQPTDRLVDGEATPAQTMELPQLQGELLGPYRILERLGEGGMAQVFLAEGPSGRQVALKVLKVVQDRAATLVKRFEREGDMLERLDHPNIVRLLDRGHDERLGLWYLAFEHVPGRNLQSILRKLPGHRLSVEEATFVLERCARALAAAHAQGILHRDVKLANVLLTPEGSVKLIDFGVGLSLDASARLSGRGEVMGTLQYLSPDLLQGGPWGPESDVYALGCVAYRLLTGWAPFPGSTLKELRLAWSRSPVPPDAIAADIPGRLSRLVLGMIDVTPPGRPSIEQVVEELQELALSRETTRVAVDWSRGKMGVRTSSMSTQQAASPWQTQAETPAPTEPISLAKSAEEALAGRRIGPYVVVRPLGRGAMGEVYLAEHPELGQRYALKVMALELSGDEEALARFEREVESLASVDAHPGIIRIHSAGRTGSGRPYFAMEFVEGSSLRERQRAGLPPEEALRLLEQVAEALAFAHQRGLVHRDVKPDNVMVGDDGAARLTDFGLVKALDPAAGRLTRTGETIGTPAYMAPEQVDASHGEVGPHTDVFALGAMIYEVFAGVPPYMGQTSIEIYTKLMEGEPIPPLRHHAPHVDPRLEAVCARALARPIAARYPDAGALLDALREARSERVAGGDRTLVVLCVLAILSVALGVGAVLLKHPEPEASTTGQARPPRPRVERPPPDLSTLLERGQLRAALTAGGDLSSRQRALLSSWAAGRAVPAPGELTRGWEGLLARGASSLARGSVPLAALAFQDALRGATDPEQRRRAALGLVQVHIARGDGRGARTWWQRARPAGATHPVDALEARVWGAILAPVVEKAITVEAPRALVELLRRRHPAVALCAARARALARLAEAGNDRDAARVALELAGFATTLAPNHPQGWEALSRAALVLHLPKEALRASEQALRVEPTSTAVKVLHARARAAGLESLTTAADVARAKGKPDLAQEQALARAWSPLIASLRPIAGTGDPSASLWLGRALLARIDRLRRAGRLDPGALPGEVRELWSVTEPLVKGVIAPVRAARTALRAALLAGDAARVRDAELKLGGVANRLVPHRRTQVLRALLLRACSGGVDAPQQAEAYLGLAGDLPARALLALRRAEAARSAGQRRGQLAHGLKLAPRSPQLLLAWELQKLDGESVVAFGHGAPGLRRLGQVVSQAPGWTGLVLELLRRRPPADAALAKALSALDDAPLARALALLAAPGKARARRALKRALPDAGESPAAHLLTAVALHRLQGSGRRSLADLRYALTCARAGAPGASVVERAALHFVPPVTSDGMGTALDRLLARGFLTNHESLKLAPDGVRAPPALVRAINDPIHPVARFLTKVDLVEPGPVLGVARLLERRKQLPRLALSLRAHLVRITGQAYDEPVEAQLALVAREQPALALGLEADFFYSLARRTRRTSRGEHYPRAALAAARALLARAPAGGALEPRTAQLHLHGVRLAKAPSRSLPAQAGLWVLRELYPRAGGALRYTLTRSLRGGQDERHPRPPLLSRGDLLDAWGASQAVLHGAQLGFVQDQATEWFLDHDQVGEARLALDRATAFAVRRTSQQTYVDVAYDEFYDHAWAAKEQERAGLWRVIEGLAWAGLSFSRDPASVAALRGLVASALLDRGGRTKDGTLRRKLLKQAWVEAKAADPLLIDTGAQQRLLAHWRQARAAGAVGARGPFGSALSKVIEELDRGRRRSRSRQLRFARAVRGDPLLPLLRAFPAYRALLQALPTEGPADQQD